MDDIRLPTGFKSWTELYQTVEAEPTINTDWDDNLLTNTEDEGFFISVRDLKKKSFNELKEILPTKSDLNMMLTELHHLTRDRVDKTDDLFVGKFIQKLSKLI